MMDWNVYLRVSALMFLEYAVWGVWMPVLALRLLGPMKMTGKQAGWIYATFPLACMFAPFASGYIADKWFNAEWIILVAQAVGAVLLFVVAKQKKFWGMFWAMLLYSICYTATLPLVNKVLFEHIPGDAMVNFLGLPISIQSLVFLWAPVAWALIGYFLTGMRQAFKMGGDGPDALYLGAFLSAVMALVCLIQPATAPKLASAAGQAVATANPIVEALHMLTNVNYLIFMVAQLVVSGMMQFYFLGTGQFMQDRGISGKNVSAVMGLAQVFQALGTMFLLGVAIEKAGFAWTFAIGAACWAMLFASYVLSRGRLVISIFQAFHGLAYVLFMIAGQMFVGAMAPKEITASAQSLIFIVTVGAGSFIGTQMAGVVMEKNCVDGKFQWAKIWSVPLVITLAGAIVFATCFKVPSVKDFQKNNPEETKAVAVVLR
ncbi:MAG: MFS transporter [Planctomycetaceae bacterium]|nr:MFS transporter [Planctomycetaceae bacterium]